MAIKVTFYLEGATLSQQTRCYARKKEIADYIRNIAGAENGQTITLQKGVDYWEKEK